MDVFRKQPSENLDYDVDFSEWIPSGDTISVAAVVADTGITVGTTTINALTHTVKQWLSGGTNGTTYKITVKVTTLEGRIKEQEFKIKVREE